MPSDGNPSVITTKKAYNNDAWHHLSAEWQPGQMQLFIDGQLVRTIEQVAGSLPASVHVTSDTMAGWMPLAARWTK